MRFVFDWDPRKAATNVAKHRVAFEEAMTVFRDPLAVIVLDPEHSDIEERWVTLGLSTVAKLLLVVHTHVEIKKDEILILIISARRPTRNEQRQYRQR